MQDIEGRKGVHAVHHSASDTGGALQFACVNHGVQS